MIINTFITCLIIVFFITGLITTIIGIIYKPPYNEKYYMIGKIAGLLFMLCIFLKIVINL